MPDVLDGLDQMRRGRWRVALYQAVAAGWWSDAVGKGHGWRRKDATSLGHNWGKWISLLWPSPPCGGILRRANPVPRCRSADVSSVMLASALQNIGVGTVNPDAPLCCGPGRTPWKGSWGYGLWVCPEFTRQATTIKGTSSDAVGRSRGLALLPVRCPRRALLYKQVV